MNKKANVHATFMDTNYQYPQAKYEAILRQNERHLILQGWKNDIVQCQLSVAAGTQSIEKLEVNPSDLTGPNGTIFKDQIRVYPIQSVNADGQEANEVLANEPVTVVAPNTLQNFWIQITIPKTTVAGSYTGQVTIEEQKLDLTLEVANQTLPDKTAFDVEFWQNPFAVAEYYQVPIFSEKHFEILTPHMEKYRAIGGNTITASIVEEPWDGQTYSKNETKFPSMVKWTKMPNGQFVFDYKWFDQWVAFNKQLHLGDKIVCYSIVPWNNKLTYFDQAKAEQAFIPVEAETEYLKAWKAFLTDFMQHLEEKGWSDNVYIGIDERGVDRVPFDLLAKITDSKGNRFKTSAAIDAIDEKKAIALQVDALSVGIVAIRKKVKEFAEIRSERKAKGLPTTVYSCMGHAPGNFSLSAPAESYWTILYGYAQNSDGFLRWAYDSWVENPLEDSSHRLFEAGDCFLVFPDRKDSAHPKPQSSVRLERLAEGIRDVNKLMILKKDPALATEINEMLATIPAYYEATEFYLMDAGKAAVAKDTTTIKQKIAELTAAFAEEAVH
ncbi:glycoside hydrolase domain-containing protein [Jeotgalibaca sp. A127]|uniref:glycoside hydrolase domain-containing protein n=1 Tax=Jeotgalibaca sp. A127 TaxID=3457324 RepID=UPI003FD6A950